MLKNVEAQFDITEKLTEPVGQGPQYLNPTRMTKFWRVLELPWWT